MRKILICCLIVLTNSLYAQVSNDICNSATSLTPANAACTPITGTLLNATTTTSTCGGYNDVYYKYVATSTSTKVTVVPSSDLDVKIEALISCTGPSIVCVNDAGTGLTESAIIAQPMSIGLTFYIRVSSVNDAPSPATFTICLERQYPPSNDECSGTTLTPALICTPTNGTLASATKSANTWCSYNNDVFYNFVASNTNTKIIVTPASGLDVVVGVSTYCSDPAIQCVNDGGAGVTENVLLSNLTVGSTYYIKIGSIVANPTIGTFTICIQNSPTNDDCSRAVQLYKFSYCATSGGTLKNATTSTGTTSSCSSYNDVFYKFTAGSNPISITVAPEATLDAVVSIYGLCTGAAVTCADNGLAGVAETLDINTLTSGKEYYIKVGSKTENPTGSTFDICIKENAPPTNDDCSTPIGLSVYTDNYGSTTSGSLQYATTTTAIPGCPSYKEVFYLFKATTSNTIIKVTPAAGLNTVVGLYYSCTSTTPDVCFDNGTAGVADVLYLHDLYVGHNYYIKVGSSTATPTAFTFDIYVSTGTNDDKEFAKTLSTAAGWCDNNINLTTATQTPGLMSCDTDPDPRFNFKYDRWFTFVATSTTYNISASRTLSNSFGVELTSATGTPMFCKKAAVIAGSGSVAAVLSGSVNTLTIGDTYYLRIGFNGLGNTNEVFKLCASPVILPPSYIECTASPALIVDNTAVSGTLQNKRVYSTTTTCTTYNSEFYTFTAETAATNITASPVLNLDVVISLYNACAGTLVKCQNALGIGGTETLSATNLTPGQQYVVQIGNAIATPNSGALPTFSVQVTNAISTDLTVSKLEEMNIFPNPASNILNLKTSLTGIKVIEIISFSGNNLLQATFNDSAYTLNIESIPQGIYLLRLTDNNGNSIIRKVSILKQ